VGAFAVVVDEPIHQLVIEATEFQGKRIEVPVNELFLEVCPQGGIVFVKYTNFVQMIAENMIKTRKLMEG
jgi:hypothetical protein